jgi:AraC-like DNA-binding protein
MKGYKNITSLLDSINVGNYQKSNEFHVLKFEDHLNELPFKTISRKCDFFQIFFSNQYNADIIIDDSPFSSKDKTLISFLAPLQTLTVDVKSVDTISNGYMLVFDVSFLKNGFSNFELQQKFPYFNLNYSPFYFLSENQSIFKELIEKMYSLFQDFSDENEEIIRSYLNILLFEARKSFFDGSIKNSLKTRAHQIAFSFESLIRKHSHSRHTLDFYANKLNISTVYLSECVKKVRNKTAKKIISEYIILEASTLLLQSSNSIDQIADKLGFSATSNFINFFKKHTNLSPTSFRNQ